MSDIIHTTLDQRFRYRVPLDKRVRELIEPWATSPDTKAIMDEMMAVMNTGTSTKSYIYLGVTPLYVRCEHDMDRSKGEEEAPMRVVKVWMVTAAGVEVIRLERQVMWRITRPERYGVNTPGHTDPKARQGYYKRAPTLSEAIAALREQFKTIGESERLEGSYWEE